MACKPGARRLGLAFALAGFLAAPAMAQQRPQAALLLERLCANSLLANEEDRLYGLISTTVRATIRERHGVFSPDLIDDAVQDSLGDLIKGCPRFAAADDGQRIDLLIELIRDATRKRLQDRAAGYNVRQRRAATAADLSQELSSPEIDAWLDALPPRRRALALFLYAAHAKPDEIAKALGVPVRSLPAVRRDIKKDLLSLLRDGSLGAPRRSVVSPPAAGTSTTSLAALLAPDASGAATVRITGITSEVYAGWSLLATIDGMAAGNGLVIDEPLLLEPEGPGLRRMLVVGLDEIGHRRDKPRRFLLKAFAIDAEAEGAGLRDGFRFAGPLDNAAAADTLKNRGLTTIETARCLWRDYGTGPDPGLCR